MELSNLIQNKSHLFYIEYAIIIITKGVTHIMEAPVINSTGIDLDRAKRILSADLVVSTKRKGSKGGKNILSLGVQYPDGNTCALRFSKTLKEQLGNPKTIQAMADGMNLIIGNNIDKDEDAISFSFPEGEGKVNLYNVPLLNWIVSEFSLDYSRGRTSRSFNNIKIVEEENGATYAVIDMTKSSK